MELRKTSHLTSRAFTLIEIVVVIALIAVIGSLAVVPSLGTYKGTLFYTDRNLLITALQRARAEAVGNICYGGACTGGVKHGVYIDTDASNRVKNFVIFQDTYSAGDPENQVIPSEGATFHSGLQTTLFSQLSGDVAPANAGTITLSDSDGHTSDVTVGAEGQIFWTH